MVTHIPNHTQAPRTLEKSGMENSQTPRRKKILIIEDEYSASKFLSFRLKKLGFEVTAAFDGMTGLKEAMEKIPDLVVLDLMIPKLPGEEVCKAIRESFDEQISKIPIIMLTGKDSMVDRILGKVIGANAYLTKPYEFSDFLDALKKIFPDLSAELTSL